MAGGRPSKYTPELGAEVCERIARGETIEGMAELAHMPSSTTIYRWRVEKDEFREAFARAREQSAMPFEERAIRYCDRLENARSVTEVQGLKEAAQILKWAAGVRAPKTHGDLTKLEHSGSGGLPLSVIIHRPEADAK
jgi:hypothetical protein